MGQGKIDFLGYLWKNDDITSDIVSIGFSASTDENEKIFDFVIRFVDSNGIMKHGKTFIEVPVWMIVKLERVFDSIRQNSFSLR
jgi:hypothetical protein